MPGRDVTCKGELLRILPLYFGQYPKAIKLMKPLSSALQEANVFSMKPEKVSGDLSFQITGNWLAALPQIFELGGEALLQFFAFAIGKPRDWFDTLDADEGLALAKAIFEENIDFFVRRIQPMLSEMGLVKVSKDPVGEQLLQDSIVSDTTGSVSS